MTSSAPFSLPVIRLYVFSARADVGNLKPEQYVVGMLGYLGAKPTDAFYGLNVLPESVAATTQFATVAGAYLTHSYGSFESVLEMQSTPGTVSFGFLRTLLARLGLGDASQAEWLFSGCFLLDARVVVVRLRLAGILRGSVGDGRHVGTHSARARRERAVVWGSCCPVIRHRPLLSLLLAISIF